MIFIVGVPLWLIDLGEVPYLNQAMAGGSTIEAIRSRYQAAIQTRADYRPDTAALSDKFLYNFAY